MKDLYLSCAMLFFLLDFVYLVLFTGEIVTIHTPDNKNLGEVWFTTTEEQFVFSVQACHRAHVYLSSGNVHSPIYNVAIGDDKNRESTIRDKDNTVVVIQETLGILNCHEERAFWLKWVDQTIRIGEGTNFEKMFMEYKMPVQEHISEISLVTEDYATGVWDFKMKSGELGFLFSWIAICDQIGEHTSVD